jgi:hypothetical protein
MREVSNWRFCAIHGPYSEQILAKRKREVRSLGGVFEGVLGHFSGDLGFSVSGERELHSVPAGSMGTCRHRVEPND